MDQQHKTYCILPGFHAGMLDAQALQGLSELMNKYAIPAMKVTSAQRIALLGMEPEELARLRAEEGLDAPKPKAPGVHYVQACPGKRWCKYGQGDSLALGKELEALELEGPLPAKVKVGVSGCRMCCCESWLRDVGLIAETKGWRFIFGGNAAGRPRIGEVVADGLTDAEAIELVRRTLNFYRREAIGKTRSSRFMERIGLDALKQAVL